jgi:glycosyltransferase involved in cell wall biosynthesis
VRAIGQHAVAKAPPGVDVERFGPPAEGWRRDGYLLSVCRLGDQRKGIGRLIRAHAALRRLVTPVPMLVIAGKGRLAPEEMELIGCLGLSGSIDVRSDVADRDLPDLYRGASVFLQTSFEEGLGLSVLEAMASGLPVVATETAGSCETVVVGITGWRVAQADDETVAERIAALLAEVLNGGIGAEFARRARVSCVERFASSRALESYLATYDALVTASRRGVSVNG